MTDQQDGLTRAQVEITKQLTADVERQAAEIERLRAALGQIAGKNDLSGVADDMVETAARNALYECELIARDALDVISDE